MSALEVQLTIEKLVFGGQGLARFGNGEVAFVWNALPGETVVAELKKQKNGVYDGIAKTILNKSPERIEPLEPHYLSSSAWGMMTYEAEEKYKKEIAAETFSKIGHLIINPEDLTLENPQSRFGYRNKMEYSFTDQNGQIELAFFARGGRSKSAIRQSELAKPIISLIADELLAWIRQAEIPIRSLKSLIVRANEQDEVIAALFIKDRLTLPPLPKLSASCRGFSIYYSTHHSPASVPTAELVSVGEPLLTEEIDGTRLQYGIFSFFQINVELFKSALEDMRRSIHPKMPLLDCYGGVGSIGLSLGDERDELVIVESNTEAIDMAKQNITLNQRANSTALCLPTEKALDEITAMRQLVLDPPRAGLHTDVIKKILLRRPPKILYLSCALDTQARDLRLLSEGYALDSLKLYNFFPATPHIESLAILSRLD